MFKSDFFISPRSCRAMSDGVVILPTDCQSTELCWSETQVHEEVASSEMSG